MRYALLIAWREYAENAKTKGFWIGLFLFPVIIMISIQVPTFLEKKGTPTRHFILVDQSGQFDRMITDTLERNHQRKVMQELHDYARKHTPAKASTDAKPTRAAVALAPSGGLDELLRELAAPNTEAIERFIRQGGQSTFLDRMKPHLREDALGLRSHAEIPAGRTPRRHQYER